MFLNYLAGAVSLVLAISAFLPWVTIWFYSLKGIENIYGIVVLLVGLLGVLVSVFQHLAGQNRGRAFIGFGVAALVSQGLYFRKLSVYGSNLNEVVELLKDLFGETINTKLQQVLGEHWSKILSKVVQRMGMDTSVNGMDFIGSGLILAVATALTLLVLGLVIEKNKPAAEF